MHLKNKGWTFIKHLKSSPTTKDMTSHTMSTSNNKGSLLERKSKEIMKANWLSFISAVKSLK